MQDSSVLSSPTTLITPPVPDLSGSTPGSLIGSPIVWLVLAIIVACIYLGGVHRQRRKLDSRELAFRTLARKMGLSREQVNSIRRYAQGMGNASPVGVILSPELVAKACRKKR